jgi:hypothetical protein
MRMSGTDESLTLLAADQACLFLKADSPNQTHRDCFLSRFPLGHWYYTLGDLAATNTLNIVSKRGRSA